MTIIKIQNIKYKIKTIKVNDKPLGTLHRVFGQDKNLMQIKNPNQTRVC